MVVHRLKNRGKVNVKLRQIFKAHGIEENLNLLTLGIGDNLTGNVDTVGLIEDVKAEVVSEIGISDLLKRAQSDFDDVLNFSASNLDYEECTPGTRRMTSSTSIWQ
jgi:hypothetical protein